MLHKLREIYQIKISLTGVEPPIWRRLLISSMTDLAELHEILQTAMGWTNTHLHLFIAGNSQYGVPDPDFDDETITEKGVRIGSLLTDETQSISYEYDFGDGWEHSIVLERKLPWQAGQQLPRCLDGSRGCPPEDVGGIWGYREFLEAWRDKTHPEHRSMVQWAGEYFDPEYFNAAEINEVLAGMK